MFKNVCKIIVSICCFWLTFSSPCAQAQSDEISLGLGDSSSGWQSLRDSSDSLRAASPVFSQPSLTTSASSELFEFESDSEEEDEGEKLAQEELASLILQIFADLRQEEEEEELEAEFAMFQLFARSLIEQKDLLKISEKRSEFHMLANIYSFDTRRRNPDFPPFDAIKRCESLKNLRELYKRFPRCQDFAEKIL